MQFSGSLRSLRSSRHCFTAITALVVGSTLSFGCSSSEDDGGSGPSGNVLVTDDNNYTVQSSLSVPTVQTAVGDVEICWDGIDQDIQCHEVDAQTQINSLTFLRFDGMSKETVQERLASGNLTNTDIDVFFQYMTDGQSTCANLSDFSLFETTPLDVAQEYTESSELTYLVIFARGTTLGAGARSMVFIEPTSTSTNTMVDAGPGCGGDLVLDFDADVTSADPVQIPASGPWIVDWSEVTRDSQGQASPVGLIDSLLVGYFQGMTAADVQAQILDLEQIATTLWEVEFSKGTKSADLANAKESTAGPIIETSPTGPAFPGFVETDGVYLMALMCSTCQNPAPVVLSVIEPTGSGE